MYRHDQSSSSSSSGYYVTTEQGVREINRLLSWGGNAEATERPDPLSVAIIIKAGSGVIVSRRGLDVLGNRLHRYDVGRSLASEPNSPLYSHQRNSKDHGTDNCHDDDRG